MREGCECSDKSCPCGGVHCVLPAKKYVKCGFTAEALCTDCAEYVLNSYDDAREVSEPVDEKWAQFAAAHPFWASFFDQLSRTFVYLGLGHLSSALLSKAIGRPPDAGADPAREKTRHHTPLG